jgi:hypothetical protein
MEHVLQLVQQIPCKTIPHGLVINVGIIAQHALWLPLIALHVMQVTI